MTFPFMGNVCGLLGKLRYGSHEVCGGRLSAKLGKVSLHGKARHNARISEELKWTKLKWRQLTNSHLKWMLSP
jgi:hypothetical protein